MGIELMSIDMISFCRLENQSLFILKAILFLIINNYGLISQIVDSYHYSGMLMCLIEQYVQCSSCTLFFSNQNNIKWYIITSYFWVYLKTIFPTWVLNCIVPGTLYKSAVMSVMIDDKK